MSAGALPRTVLVTGAGKGIGAAVSLALAAQGHRVALAARTAADLARLAERIRGQGGEAFPVACDVTDTAAIDAAVAAARAALGPITILVNNAGAAGSHKFLGHPDDLWERMLAVNLTSAYHVTKAVLPDMLAARWGRVINIASVAAKTGGKYIAAYTASKHGVLGLTRALAVELAAEHITVNAVCPGYVDTPMTDQAVENIAARTRLTADEARATLARTSPQQRLITPEEVAAVVVMLAGESARGITGQAINVDGGTIMS
jgi:NAD(P)-dependent dehydrogenase (short-subunit alcohol dehydrogenase family)